MPLRIRLKPLWAAEMRGFMSTLLKYILASVVFCPIFVLGQINDEPSSDVDSAPAGVTSTSSLKFRGFKSAAEDLPFMNEDWKVSYFQLAATEPARFDDKKATALFFYNYFSFNYKINDSSRFSVRPVFTLESPGVNKYNDTVSQWNLNWGDWYAQYSKFDLFEIGPFGSRTNLRLYAPTSEASANNGMIAQIHPELFFETSFRRGSGIEVAFKGDYYLQSKKAYSFKTESGRTIFTTNKEAELESYIEFNQKLSSKFNLKPRVSWFDEWKHSSPANGFESSHSTEFSIGLGLDWHPTNNFNTLVIYSNKTPYYGRYKEKFLLPDNNELVALTNYRF
jgi:hypothetical protein